MHSLHLFRSVDYRCKTDTVPADRLVKLCIGRTRHHIRTGGQSRESIRDGLLHQMECFSVNIHRRRIIVGMQHFSLKSVLISHLFDDLQAFFLSLMRNKTHVRTDISFLRQHIIGIGALLHRESDRRLQHGTCLGTDRRHDRF